MNRARGLMSAVLLCLLAMTSTWKNQAQNEDGLLISRAWARPTALSDPEGEATQEPTGSGMTDAVSAAYLIIENQDNRIYRLIAATSTAADSVEIHQTRMVDDVMQMRPVTDGIEIPDGTSVTLEPGGFHIMLMNLKRDLIPGNAIMLSLLFDMPYEDGLEAGATHTVIVGVPILEQPPEPLDIVVDHAWARPTVMEGMKPSEPETAPEAGAQDSGMGPGSDVSAVYMTLINEGGMEYRLVEAWTEVAAISEIHQTSMENDVMRMRLIDGIDLPARGTIQMRPGGFHIMLLDLRLPLIPGEAIVVILKFASGDELLVAVPVYDAQIVENQGGSHD